MSPTGPQDAAVSVAAVVLAGGEAVRMGRQKLLLELQGRPVIRWVVEAALASAVAETVVVVGHEAGRVGAQVEDLPVTIVLNEDYREGMSSSLRAGLQAVRGRCDAALFLLGDQPFVTPELLDRLISSFAVADKAIVRPEAAGAPANPVLVGAALFPEMLAQHGDVGGREVVARHPDEVLLVPVDDPWVAVDIDSAEDYEAARKHP